MTERPMNGEGSPLIWATMSGRRWSQVSCGGKAHLRGDGPEGVMVGELSLSCVRRDRFSRNLFEEVSARSGTRTKLVTTYNAAYGVLPCFLTFSTFLFRMDLNLEKRPAGPPKSMENQETADDGRLKGAFSRLQRPWRVL